MRQRRRAAGIFSASQQRCISYSSFRCDGSSTGPFARPKPQSGASCGASEARFFFIARAVEQRCSCLSPSVRREGGSDAACCGDVAASNAMRARHQTFLEFGAPKPGVESLFRDRPRPFERLRFGLRSSRVTVPPPILKVGKPAPILGKTRQAACLICILLGFGLAGSLGCPLSELGFVGHVAPHPLSPVWQATPVSKVPRSLSIPTVCKPGCGRRHQLWDRDPSVPILKFAPLCSPLFCELRNRRDTSILLILVWLWFRSPQSRTSGGNDADF